MNKRKLLIKSISVGIMAFVIFNLALFLPAGSIYYWNAWIFNFVTFVPLILFVIYMFHKDPKLLERRLNYKEREKEQKILQLLGIVEFLALFLLPGFDFRYHWSFVPLLIVILSNIGYFLGYLFIIRVFIENSYASRIIQVEKNQKVISTGPYAYIRHPMYLGVLIMYFFMPIALGSFYALIAFIFLPVHIIQRIRNEEKVLEKELPGYDEYKEKVKFKLIPKIW